MRNYSVLLQLAIRDIKMAVHFHQDSDEIHRNSMCEINITLYKFGFVKDMIHFCKKFHSQEKNFHSIDFKYFNMININEV
jgi:hypothetical protein